MVGRVAHDLVRTGSGAKVHKKSCRFAAKGVEWRWAEGRRIEEIVLETRGTGVAPCHMCDPYDGLYEDGVYYSPSGRVISLDQARDIFARVTDRTFRQTKLAFLGHQLLVSTVFVPIDHNPETWGTKTDHPYCWVTELIGGPPDLDGRHGYHSRLREALNFHDEVVDLALAAGCIVV